MNRIMKSMAVTVGALSLAMAGGTAVAQEKQITIGTQTTWNPWKVAIADGAFEEATGYDIEWRHFDSGALAITAFASGSVDIVVAGSSPLAAAISRGVDLKLFWIVFGIAEGEALVVRDGSGIETPQDLKGKNIAVPFVSTTHYHMMFALEHWGIDPSEVNLLNLAPNEAAAAWARGDIDAAFVWNPALGRIMETGEVLITSGELCELGKCTFDGMVVDPEFAESDPEFMVEFVKVLAKADSAYRQNPDAWTADSPMVQKIVDLIGGNAEDVPVVLSQYTFPTLEEQASETWLGGGADSGAAQALKDTAQFLKEQGKVSDVPEDMGQYVTDRWVEAAMKEMHE